MANYNARYGSTTHLNSSSPLGNYPYTSTPTLTTGLSIGAYHMGGNTAASNGGPGGMGQLGASLGQLAQAPLISSLSTPYHRNYMLNHGKPNYTGDKPSGIVLANDFRLYYKIGSGSFGEIFLAQNTKTKSEVAVKVESVKTKPQSLPYESKVYQRLRGGPGIPEIHYFGTDKVRELNILVMDLLGPSLEDLFKFCGGKLTYKTTIMLADQMIERVEFLHSRNLLHRDIKPDNFMMGIGNKCNTVFLADYGLAKRYRNSMGKHIKFRDDKCLTGTARYASVNTHYGAEQSRRDDLESLGYVLLYFMKGKLPWQNLKTNDRHKNRYEAIAEKKLSTPIHVLCQSCPVEFQMFLQYTRGLKFDETPDYSYLRMLFRVLLNSLGYEMDHVFDWTQIMNAQSRKGENSLSSGYASSESQEKRNKEPDLGLLTPKKNAKSNKHGGDDSGTLTGKKQGITAWFWATLFRRGQKKSSKGGKDAVRAKSKTVGAEAVSSSKQAELPK